MRISDWSSDVCSSDLRVCLRMELVVKFLLHAQFMCDHASKVLGRTLFQDGQPASRGHRRITIGHKQILASRSTPRHVYDGAFFPLKPLVESNRFRAQDRKSVV